MPSKLVDLVMAVVTAVLLVGALVVSLWPVETELETGCGSFLASNSATYDEAFNMFTGTIGTAMLESGTSERSVGFQSGTFENIARNLALEEVDECGSARGTMGAIAGGLLLLGLCSGGVLGYRVHRSRTEAPRATRTDVTA